MKQLNTYILEKLILEKLYINKDIKVKDNNADNILTYNEFLANIDNNIQSLEHTVQHKEAEEILKNSFQYIKLRDYEYLYIDPSIYKDNWRYKFQIEQAADFINHPKKIDNENGYEHKYSYNIIDLSIYLYTNYNLSNDDGDEYYIYFFDFMNSKFYIYQFIKNGKRNIKELK